MIINPDRFTNQTAYQKEVEIQQNGTKLKKVKLRQLEGDEALIALRYILGQKLLKLPCKDLTKKDRAERFLKEINYEGGSL